MHGAGAKKVPTRITANFLTMQTIEIFFIQPVTTLKGEKNISYPGNNKVLFVKTARIPSPHITVYLLDLFSE